MHLYVELGLDHFNMLQPPGLFFLRSRSDEFHSTLIVVFLPVAVLLFVSMFNEMLSEESRYVMHRSDCSDMFQHSTLPGKPSGINTDSVKNRHQRTCV